MLRRGEELEDVVDMEDLTTEELSQLDFQTYFKMGLVTLEVCLHVTVCRRWCEMYTRCTNYCSWFAFSATIRLLSFSMQEWELIKQQEENGVQGWRTVYTWAAALLAEAVSHGRMEDRLVRILLGGLMPAHEL